MITPPVQRSKVLVVDDAPEIRLLVKGVLEDEDLEVGAVETGAEALEWLRRDPVDLIVLDLELPDVQGTALCKGLRERGLTLPIVMLTSRNASHQRVVGLECGADDYLGKPFEPEELVARVRSQLRREGGFRQRLQRLLDLQWRRIQTGIDLAQRIQTPFPKPMNGLAAAVRHIPMGRIGGDFFLTEDLGEGRSAVVMADAMGKGLGASLVMALSLSWTHDLLRQGLGPGPLLCRLNRELAPELSRLQSFVALFIGIFDRTQGRFDYACAGGEPPIWLRRRRVRGRRHQRLTTDGVPIGVLPDHDYEQKVVFPDPGDRLFLCTDGLSEAVPWAAQPALLQGLYRRLLRQPALEPSAALEELLTLVAGRVPVGTPLRDDLTCLLLEFC